MEISVANYQITPTDPAGEMLRYFGDKYGADFKVYNFDNQHFHEQLNVRIAAGEIPDFLYLRTATSLISYARLGVLAAIPDSLLRTNAPRLVRALESYAPGYLRMGRVDGVQYGIPVVSPTNIFHIPLVYRKDWMTRVGVSKTPETLAEFEELMYKFARDDPDGDGRRDTYGLSRDGLAAVFGAYGLVPFDEKTEYWVLEDGQVINAAISLEAKKALALLAKWYRDGIIDPEFITGENKGGYWALSHAFLSGRIGFTTHGNYYHWITDGAYDEIDKNGRRVPVEANANGRELPKSQREGKIVFGPPLVGPGGKRGIKSYNRLMNFVTIGKSAEQCPGKIATILRILDASASADPVERLGMHYGIEGRHWKLLDRATESFVILPPWDEDEGYWSRIGCVLSMEVPLPPKAPRELWAQGLGLDRDGISSLVQVGLPTMMQYDEALRKLRIEAYIAIITGARSVDSFDQFVASYLAAGGAAVQREVDQYYAGTR
jgi:putative aldouronate transport system substrate-binding protein